MEQWNYYKNAVKILCECAVSANNIAKPDEKSDVAEMLFNAAAVVAKNTKKEDRKGCTEMVKNSKKVVGLCSIPTSPYPCDYMDTARVLIELSTQKDASAQELVGSAKHIIEEMVLGGENVEKMAFICGHITEWLYDEGASL